MNAIEFVKMVLKEQIEHGEHGDAEYIRLAQQILNKEGEE